VISGISDWFLKGTSNLQILRTVRSLVPTARVIVTGDTSQAAQELYAAGADYVVVPAALTADHLATLLADSSPNALARARRAQAFELFGR
jgi:DNA-binding NarL/FixJ family response regulator